MESFVAEVRFRFEAENLRAAGHALRHLGQAAQDAGFEMREGKVTPALEDEERSEGTGYGPPIDDPGH